MVNVRALTTAVGDVNNYYYSSNQNILLLIDTKSFSVRVSYYSQRGDLEASLRSLKNLRLLNLELDHHSLSIADNLADHLNSFPLSKVFEVLSVNIL